MTAWLVAAAVGAMLAALTYAGRADGRRAPFGVVAAVLRGLAATLLVALLLDAPAGRAEPPAPLVALDVSQSWTRGGGTEWEAARDLAASLASDPLLLVGDSARADRPPAAPTDLASAARAAVERALAAGRPLILVTDGEVDDPDVLDRLPVGSSVRVRAAAAAPDLAAVTLDAPRSAVGGDTIPLRARVAAGSGGSAAGELRLLLDDARVAATPVPALAAFAERTIEVSVVLPRREGTALLRAVTVVPGDGESRNDTLAVPIELSAVAGVTVLSTAPDFDLRYMLEVLRGTVSLPSRAYVQVTPGQWRLEGSLAPVDVETVRAAARRAPILVLHGDTTFLGTPSSAGSGALLLVPAPAVGEATWYATGAPPSPIAPLLSGAAWDSLPPLAVGTRPPTGEWTGLTVQRERRLERQAAIAGSESPRRRAVVGVGGLWRWRFRGGAAGDAYAAAWGGVFDWLAAERRDRRAALPEAAVLRSGEPVRWRRGGTDSVVTVTVARRGDADSVTYSLRFPDGAPVATTPPLAAGVYDVRVAGGSAVLAVNASRELLPRRPAVADGPVGSAPAPVGIAPLVRGLVWVYVLVVALLCAEWLVRRKAGLR